MMFMTKQELRQRLKEQRDSLLPEVRDRYSKALREQLLQSDLYRSCDMLFAYMSFRSEVETKEIIRQALVDHKRVYLPGISGKDMEFYEIQGLEDLVLSPYGILEPRQTRKNRFEGGSSELSLFKVMLLPGLGFDIDGNRIGYGAGYYDKYLSRYDASYFTKIALAYELQVVDAIEADIHDKRADYILTPERLIRCHRLID